LPAKPVYIGYTNRATRDRSWGTIDIVQAIIANGRKYILCVACKTRQIGLFKRLPGLTDTNVIETGLSGKL
jgi:hypothetical protein